MLQPQPDLPHRGEDHTGEHTYKKPGQHLNTDTNLLWRWLLNQPALPPLSHFSSSPFGVCICSAGSHLQPCLQWSKHCKRIKHLPGLKYAPAEKPSFLHRHSCQDFQDKSALYCPSGQTEEWTGPRIIYRLFIPPCILVWNTAFVCSLTLSKCWGQNSGLNLLPPPPCPCPPEQVRWSRIVTGHCWPEEVHPHHAVLRWIISRPPLDIWNYYSNSHRCF